MADEMQAIRTIRQAMLERKLRRKAILDSFLLLASIASAFVLAPGLKQALLATAVVATLGVALFIARRSADLRLLARADDWRTRALDGRGISLAAWHSGAALPPRTDRH